MNYSINLLICYFKISCNQINSKKSVDFSMWHVMHILLIKHTFYYRHVYFAKQRYYCYYYLFF